MASSEHPPARRPRPWRTIGLSVLLFFALDALLFRSGLYGRFGDPGSTPGKVFDMVYFNQVAPMDPARDVYLLGSSKTEWGFGIDDFFDLFPGAPINPIMGASPGSNEEWWYYELLAIDPHHDRFRAIVVPIAGYKVYPWREDKENSYTTAQALAPIISPAAWPSFLQSFTDIGVRLRVLALALFSSHDYVLDVQTLLLHPIWRYRSRIDRAHIGRDWLRDNHGSPSTLTHLIIDSATKKPISYPKWYDDFKKHETYQEFVAPTSDEAKAWTARNAAFEAKWVALIVQAYQGSKTQLIFIDIPHEPMSLPAQLPIPDAPDVQAMIPDAPNVTVIPEDAFSYLERPQYFADVLHLNNVGHQQFTIKLGGRLLTLLASDSTRARDSAKRTAAR
jgi:hypothetical protein